MSITKNEVYTNIAKAIRNAFTGAYVVGERVYSPSKFPCVWVVEVDSAPELNATALDLTDEQRRSTFEVQAFSNLKSGATAQAKSIIDAAEATFRTMGYRMTMSQPVDNGSDVSIKRHVARFTRFIGGGDALPQ